MGFGQATLTLKIERRGEKDATRLRLCGELRSAHLDAVRAEIATVAPPVILDLEEVDLVDIDAVRFLNECQTQGVRVEDCTPYIREWMHQEKRGGGKS